MQDYKRLYFALFNGISDAITVLEQAQQEGESMYLVAEIEKIALCKEKKDKS